MSEDAEIRGVIPNYYAFIIDKLNRIYDAEDKNNYPLALDRALKLTKFLPRKLKKEIVEDVKRIRQRLITEAKIDGYFLDSMLKERNKIVYNIAYQEEDKFMDKMTSLLDQEHLLTQSYGIPTRARSMGDIQRTVDVARYQSGE